MCTADLLLYSYFDTGHIGRYNGVATCACPSPQQDPVLLFSHTYSPKSTRVGGHAPPKGNPRLATGSFLDLALQDEHLCMVIGTPFR